MIEPICRHFGVCGGCQLQNLDAQEYQARKQALVADAFTAAGLPTATMRPLIACPPAARRRVTFSARRTKKTVQVGFFRRESHDLMPVEECPILEPKLQELLAHLPSFLRAFLSRRGVIRATFTVSTTGVACSIAGDAKLPDAAAVEQLARLAQDVGICEIAIDREPLVTHAQPLIDMAGTLVRLPPNGFLQATRAAQIAMQEMIEDAVRKARAAHVVDLFSGIGTFTFAAARHASVHAVEIDHAAVEALTAARDRSQGLRQITAEQRNLMKNPVPADRLKDADAVIFDPPRAGARAQVREIASAMPQMVIAVSCDPSTLTRDLNVLQDAGYEFERIQPIDQFAFTDHVETLAILRHTG